VRGERREEDRERETVRGERKEVDTERERRDRQE
jgi:hypothetical protein